VSVWTGFNYLRIGTMAHPSEDGNKTLFSIKTENSSTISIISAFEEGLSSIQLGECSDSRPGYFIHEKRNRYTLDRRLGVLQSRPGSAVAKTDLLLFRVVFWDILPCKMIVESLMMEAVCTSETSVDTHFTRQYEYIPEDNSEHHTRRRENLKSQRFIAFAEIEPR
jgi:hypothetical protein